MLLLNAFELYVMSSNPDFWKTQNSSLGCLILTQSKEIKHVIRKINEILLETEKYKKKPKHVWEAWEG